MEKAVIKVKHFYNVQLQPFSVANHILRAHVYPKKICSEKIKKHQ